MRSDESSKAPPYIFVLVLIGDAEESGSRGSSFDITYWYTVSISSYVPVLLILFVVDPQGSSTLSEQRFEFYM